MRAWNDYVRTELDAETDAATLGGFVTGLLGRIPREGDACRWGNVRFTVLEVSRRSKTAPGRPLRIRVEILDGAGAGGEADAGPSGDTPGHRTGGSADD
jgi:Mg2+/Co2+ transporter CorC